MTATKKTINDFNPILKIDFKNFKLAELKAALIGDVKAYQVKKVEYTEVKDFTNAEIKIIESEFLTIGDHSEIEVSKGSENLYFDFSCYIEDDEKKFYSQIKISIFTKENHDFLKEVICPS